MRAFRLCAAHRDPRDPTGAKKWGGRWNSPGKAILYAASFLSLACLEILVHLRNPANLPEFIYTEIRIATEDVVAWSRSESETQVILESEELSREIGNRWLSDSSLIVWPLEYQAESVPVMEVPSIVVPQERNYLINPEHPQFSQLTWSKPQPFRIDPRLIDPGLR